MTLYDPSCFPTDLRNDLENICASTEVKKACIKHTKNSGKKLLDKFFFDQLSSRGYSVKSDRLWVAENSKFDLDLLVSRSNWQAAILIEGGKASRIDLDLLKFIAWGSKQISGVTRYADLIASDKKLVRNITGTASEAAFDYLKRLRALFYATSPKVADLLVVEFRS